MKLRLLASALPLLLIASAPLALAQGGPPPGPPHEHRPKTALEKDMDRINHAMRTLKGQITDPSQNASSLAEVSAIHEAAEAALKETPAKAADVPEAARPKFVADFRAAMKAFIGNVDQLSAALKAGDNAAAARDLIQLGQDERKDHHQFRKPPPKRRD